MERLIVKNFGPITSADIDVRQFTLLIGHVSSGKSTIAKLLSIFHSKKIYSITSDSTKDFVKLLEDYNIDFPINSDTEIVYNNGDYEWRVGDKGLFTTLPYREVIAKLLLRPVLNVRETVLELSKTYPDLYDILGDKIKAIMQSEKKAIFDDNFLLWFRVSKKIMYRLGLKMSSLYIPAERNIFSILDRIIYNIYNNNSSIPKSLLDFGSYYESAKQDAKKQSKQENRRIKMPFSQNTTIDFGDDTEEGTPELYVSVNQESRSPMRQVSSGLQSLVPLFLCVEFMGKWQNVLLIEEPESNLFPTVQNELIRYIVATTNQMSKGKCIITSHSPYILSSFDALVQAGNASEKNAEETAKIVPRELWIKYEDISCYYFDEKGNVTNVKNDELRNIGSEAIDGVSDTINEEYDRLLNIIYS
jgi:ABC-type ATPase involved in cell division